MALPLGDAGTILQKKKSFAPTCGDMVKDVQDGSKGLAVAQVCSDTLLLHAENCIGIRDSSRFALADRTGRHQRGTSQLHANTSGINGELSLMTGRESFGIPHAKHPPPGPSFQLENAWAGRPDQTRRQNFASSRVTSVCLISTAIHIKNACPPGTPTRLVSARNRARRSESHSYKGGSQA